jgi:hypothetical protein
MAPHAILVDLDPEARPVEHVRAAAFSPNGVCHDIFGKPGVGQGEAPGDVRDDGRDM